jgi:peptide/nickel transport system substrate-binding protein
MDPIPATRTLVVRASTHPNEHVKRKDLWGAMQSKLLRRAACAVISGCAMTLGMATVAPTTSEAAAITKSTVTFAEPPGASPNYIFPYRGAQFTSTQNTSGLQELMFRPLYFFGGPNNVNLNERLSLAKPPIFSNGDRTVEILLKTYRWADGSVVDATDVMFWMNIWRMDPTGYVGWFPGGLSMPTSVKSVTITNPQTVTITFDRSFNPRWLLYNQLSQIVPLPLAWTKTTTSAAAGSAGCATSAYGADDSACKAVYTYLSEQSGFNPTRPQTTVDALPTYATNPLWKVVDGPWELTSFGPTAPVVFKPNPTYSGPNKPKIKKFIEEPFTTDSAEFNALATGTVDFGYLPVTDVTSSAAAAGKAGKNPTVGKNNPRLATYDLEPFYTYGINYVADNFNSAGDTGSAGAIFSQLYFRQAVQHLVDQTLYVHNIYKGYAYPDYGPVPTIPTNPYSSKSELKNPYPYSVSTAKKLLASHGWKIVHGGTSTCQKPGAGPDRCGKGVAKGAKLAFTLQYDSGDKALSTLMSAERASWSQVGINVTLRSANNNTVLGSITPCSGKSCAWELAKWTVGIAIIFAPPAVYPTGTEVFATGARANFGSFSTAHNNALIKKTVVSRAPLTQYENYLENELPVIWQPVVVTLYEIRKGLEGAAPLDPLTTFTPATFRWK